MAFIFVFLLLFRAICMGYNMASTEAVRGRRKKMWEWDSLSANQPICRWVTNSTQVEALTVQRTQEFCRGPFGNSHASRWKCQEGSNFVWVLMRQGYKRSGMSSLFTRHLGQTYTALCLALVYPLNDKENQEMILLSNQMIEEWENRANKKNWS